MLSPKRGYAAGLGRPTTNQLSAFLYKFFVRCGPIHGVAHRPSHHNRLFGEVDISCSPGRSNRSMVMFSDRPPHVFLTIADTGYTNPNVGEASPTYA